MSGQHSAAAKSRLLYKHCNATPQALHLCPCACAVLQARDRHPTGHYMIMQRVCLTHSQWPQHVSCAPCCCPAGRAPLFRTMEEEYLARAAAEADAKRQAYREEVGSAKLATVSQLVVKPPSWAGSVSPGRSRSPGKGQTRLQHLCHVQRISNLCSAAWLRRLAGTCAAGQAQIWAYAGCTRPDRRMDGLLQAALS